MNKDDAKQLIQLMTKLAKGRFWASLTCHEINGKFYFTFDKAGEQMPRRNLSPKALQELLEGLDR